MYNIEELKKERCKATCLRVGCLVTAVTEPMAKRQPFFLNENPETFKCAIEWIEH